MEAPLPIELRIWLKCRQYSATLNGQAGLPQAGGYLDQDAELMLAFEVLEDLDKTLKEEEVIREKTREAAAARLHGTG
ncbi:MAG TPA: hypothetical protein VFP52_12300 [Myxococcales bacterium]|nr:hypothetical protein [Myxococcales bacterium]